VVISILEKVVVQKRHKVSPGVSPEEIRAQSAARRDANARRSRRRHHDPKTPSIRGNPEKVGLAMSAVKEEAIRLIQSLPEDCSIEDIQYHLYVRQKVETGLTAVESGRFVSQEDAERRIEEWVKSTGPNPRSTTSETS
jgi:predicted transcriptional regulator